MDLLFNFIHWGPDPTLFKIGSLEPRWYGLLFAGSFFVAILILQWIFKIEKKTQKDLDALAITIIACVVIGARMGHVIFYAPEYYFSNPIEIIKIWEGGLASHGAAFAILIGVWLYSRKRPDQSFLWVADRLVIVVALCAVFVRMGNLMNSEICGIPTHAPWGFVFNASHLRDGADCYCSSGATEFARHPTQLYEALSYLLIFGLLLFLYNRTRTRTPEGRLAGILLSLMFTVRFLIEFVKMNQEDYNNGLPINAGQLLSLPLIALGLYFLFSAKTKNQPESLSIDEEIKG